jgi:type 1 fimbria pilin
MKRKIIVALLLVLPKLAAGATATQNLTIKGETYNACTVTWPNTLAMGEHQANRWLSNNDYLSPVSNWNEVNIRLSNCDTNTKVRVSTTGTRSADNDWYLVNNSANSAPALFASLQIYSPNSNNTWKTMKLDGNEYVDVTTVANSTTTYDIRLRGLLRRIDTSVKPAGKFSANATIILTFL